MRKNRSVPKMQNPPPQPPPPAPSYRLRLYHCGNWYLAFGENGKLIETSKITIEENFPDKGQEAIIRMPVEIINEEPGGAQPIETRTKCGPSVSWSFTSPIKLKEENEKLRIENEMLSKKNELDDRIYCREIKELNAEVKQLRGKIDEMRSVLDYEKGGEL